MAKKEGLTRAKQRLDVTYVCPDGGVFWTPDGEGRYWYDTIDEAIEGGGPRQLVHLTEMPEDY